MTAPYTRAAEFTGPTMSEMSIAGRMTICNMAVEMGAKNGIIEPDETTRKFLEGRIKAIARFEPEKATKTQSTSEQ